MLEVLNHPLICINVIIFVTCNVKAVMIMERAREPVSRRLKLRSIFIPRIHATITVNGTTNKPIWVADPNATPKDMSCKIIFVKNEFMHCIIFWLIHKFFYKAKLELTSLFLKAKMMAPACSAAFPTIGSNIILMKLTDRPHDSDAF